jgi:hypothetical protein
VTWSQIAGALTQDVGAELVADAPGVIHHEAKSIGLVQPGGELVKLHGFWERYQFIILAVLGIGIVWYFFFRK